jgi:hypothetical protein
VQLLVVVLHSEEMLDDVLSILVEHELPDAVVAETRTSLELLERDLPIFAGLRSLIPGGIDFSRLVLCLLDRPNQGAEVLRDIGELGGRPTDDDEPTNTALLLPVDGIQLF